MSAQGQLNRHVERKVRLVSIILRNRILVGKFDGSRIRISRRIRRFVLMPHGNTLESTR